MKNLVRLAAVLSVAFAVGCGESNEPVEAGPDAGPAGADACVAESNDEFCVRMNASCGVVNDKDNCGATRAVECGTCSGGLTCFEKACVNQTGCEPMCGGDETCIDGACKIGCQIGGSFYEDGTVNPLNPCQSCQFTVSASAWSNVVEGTTCSDGDACTQADTCVAGACVGANPVVCEAKDQCHDVGTCDPATGVCSDPAKADATPCDDGNLCTQIDTCVAGACTGGNPVVCEADQCHVAGTCEPTTGVCSAPVAKDDSTACNDGNACTTADTCQAGVCVGAAPVVCTALDQCHDVGVCDTATGLCSNPAKADDTGCDDNNGCTTSDVCKSGVCTAGPRMTCGDTQTCVDTAGVGECKENVACELPQTTCGPICCVEADLCNDKGACVPRCVPESDAEFCARANATCGAKTAADNCGVERTVADCGACGAKETCTANACVCVPESETEFCSRLNAACGALTAPDNCNASRTVASCGTCTGANMACTATNVCKSTCAAEPSYGPITATPVVKLGTSQSPASLYVDLPTTDGTKDQVSVQMYPGSGVFANGVKPGTYTIAGDELNFKTCGLCVQLFADIDSSGAFGARYMATGGTVQVTSVTGPISMVLTNVTFEQVNIAQDYTSTPHPSGCQSAIPDTTLSGDVTCGVPASYGAVTMVPGSGYAESEPGFLYMEAALNEDPDYLTMEMYEGSGVFATGLKTGVFTLSGDELNYQTCGLCVIAYDEGDVTYMATGGKVTLTQVAGTLTGSVSDVTFTAVTIDPTTYLSTPVPGGCSTKIESMPLSIPITAP